VGEVLADKPSTLLKAHPPVAKERQGTQHGVLEAVPKRRNATMKITALLLSPLLLSGCAGILHGTSDTLSVNSMEDNTIIYVDGTPRGRDTATAQLKRGDDHKITASKEGCRDVSMETTDSFDPASLLGIFWDFGILSIPIDLVSGAAWKTDQAIVTLSPICPPKTALAPAPPRSLPPSPPTPVEAWEPEPNRNILAR
jgi:hypothetical protein